MVFPGFYALVKRVPGGQNAQVFFGTSLLLGIAAIPIIRKETRAGHDYFSQEKPEAIAQHQEQQQKQYFEKKIASRSN